MKIFKNIKQAKTTVLGVICIVCSFVYLFYVEDLSSTIFFGLLGTGVSFLLLPDSILKGIESLISKNKGKEL